MARYRRAKDKVETAIDDSKKKTTPVARAEDAPSKGDTSDATDADDKNKRIPYNSLKLQLAGDMVVVKCPDPKYRGLFRRYEELFETLANMETGERLLNYKFLCGLMLTGHARRVKEVPKRRQLFDLKNKIFFSIAKVFESRRRVSFRYLKSKRVRVLEFCENCTKTNTEAGTNRFEWTHCEQCKVDKDFFNVLAMHHKFPKGHATLYLSNDLIKELAHLNIQTSGDRGDIAEEALFGKYHYEPRMLEAFELDSVLKLHAKLLK